MIRKTGFTGLCLLSLLIVIIAATAPVSGYNNGYAFYATVNDSSVKQLILNVYVDEAGKALVTGYVEQEDIDSFRFLKTSEYLYENDTKQLYALTNALTWKYGDDWGLNFTTSTYYSEYHTIFYLPGDVRLGRIECTEGVDYFVSASNESIVIDMQGYDVESPMTTIEYRQPLRETSGEGTGFEYLLPITAAISVLLAIALIIAIVKMKRRGDNRDEKADAVKKGEIEITSEIARVMETLTDRERTIVNALIKHNGEMTQADLRYETEIAKSSLSGILRTLERRKIIRKKEWGRTNVIELSEWFVRKKGV
ncbi:MAG: helix-turn-helix domain-containing protein [Halobacteriota archaeon]